MARKAFLLRLDPAVLAEMERWAADEFRSVNGQIEFVLRQALVKRGKEVPVQAPEKPDEETKETTE